MSAGILKNDQVVATEATWHRMEHIEKKITFENSRLGWLVESSPVQDSLGTVIPGYQLLSTETEGNAKAPLGILKGRYTPIQNSAIFEAVEKALDGVPHKITCAGSLHDRRKVFISVQLTGKGNTGFEVNGDKFKAHLNFLSSHDGSMSFEIFDSNTRVVCQNTFNMARSAKASSKIRQHARHTKGAQFKIDGIVKEIQKALTGREIFKVECEKLFKIACTEDQALAFAVGWLFPEHREKPSNMVMENARGIAGAFSHGDGNHGANRYDLFNGVTQFFTRNVTRQDSDVYSSSFIGLGATRKGEAFDIITDSNRFKETVKRGEKGLALIA